MAVGKIGLAVSGFGRAVVDVARRRAVLGIFWKRKTHGSLLVKRCVGRQEWHYLFACALHRAACQPRAGLTRDRRREQRRKARVAGRYSGGILSRRGIIAACDRAASRAAPPRPRPRPRPRRPFPRPRAAGLRARGRGGPRARTRLRPCPASSSSPSLASREGAKPGPIRKPLALYLTECVLLMVCALRP